MEDEAINSAKEMDKVPDPSAQAETTADQGKVDAIVREILCDVLGLDPKDVAEFDEDTGLFGHLPELDSMAVAGLLTEMEDRLDIVIDDDEIDGEMLEDFGGLLGFAQMKADEA